MTHRANFQWAIPPSCVPEQGVVFELQPGGQDKSTMTAGPQGPAVVDIPLLEQGSGAGVASQVGVDTQTTPLVVDRTLEI